MRGVEGPRRCLLTDAFAGFPAANHNGRSCIFLFELAWLARNQRIVLKTSLEAFLLEVEARFVIPPITAAVTRIAVAFSSPYPLDPMDRIIGATALDRGVPLVTKDKMIRKAKAFSVIW